MTKINGKARPIPRRSGPVALVFDTETTGLIRSRILPENRQPEIVEFFGALISLPTGNLISSFETLVKPRRSIPDDVIKIHGITDERVKNAPSFDKVAAPIMKLIGSADVIIAHNLSFDKEMLSIEFGRIDCASILKDTWKSGICTVEQTAHLLGRRLKLGELYRYLFDEDFTGAHRASKDVDALCRIACELYKRGQLMPETRKEGD